MTNHRAITARAAPTTAHNQREDHATNEIAVSVPGEDDSFFYLVVGIGAGVWAAILGGIGAAVVFSLRMWGSP